jgi:hypothetical protein
MIAPPLLTGATLLFWGWQTGHPLVGAILGVALEIARQLRFRLQLGTDEHANIADLSTIGFVTLAVLLSADRGMSRGILEAFIWLPAALSPILAAQLFTESRRIPLSALFRYMRKLRRRNPEIKDPPVDVSMVYVALALVSAGVANARGIGYYAGVVAATAWALYAVRPRGARGFAAAAVMLAAGATLGYGGQRGLENLQSELENWVGDLYLRNFDADPYRSVTEIGTIGRLKQYDAILMRVYADQKDSARVQLLHRASYTAYAGTSWIAREAQMHAIDARADGTTWDLVPSTAAGAPTWRTRIVAHIEHGKSLLALPPGTARIANLTAVSVRRNVLGAVHVDAGIEWVQYEPEALEGIAGYDAPGLLDTSVPPAERPAFERAAAELGLRDVPPAEAVRRVEKFLGGFTYSLYRDRVPPQGATALGDFLQRTRSGHCEYFASATALLLRSAGIPARYATGFAVTEYSRLEQAYVVRSRHGHAWTRAWLDGRWVDLDFTPPDWVVEEAREAPLWQGLADLARWLGFRWTMREEFKANDAWYGVLVVLALILGWRLFGHKRVDSKAAATGDSRRYPGEDSEFYAVEKSFDLRASGETHAAWLARIAQTQPVQKVDVLRDALRLHQRYRFDPAGLAKEERRRLRELCLRLAPQT